MKTHSLLYVLIISLFICSCELEINNNSNINFYVKSSITKNDTLVFTAKNIKFYNNSTHELRFNDNTTPANLKLYGSIKCYIGTDSLFEARLTSDIMSNIINDLVLNHNLQEDKFYFEDGYPGWIDNLGATTLRAENKTKREKAWLQFIAELKKEKKYIEK